MIKPTKRRVGKRKGPEKATVASLYEKYPLPFFDRARLLTWAAEPTGHYAEDCETGRAFAIEFLKSNDGTAGWATLLGSIVNDMIRAGPKARLLPRPQARPGDRHGAARGRHQGGRTMIGQAKRFALTVLGTALNITAALLASDLLALAGGDVGAPTAPRAAALSCAAFEQKLAGEIAKGVPPPPSSSMP